MIGHEWVEIGRIPAPEPNPVSGGGLQPKAGVIAIWKLFSGSTHTEIYAIGRTLETAVIARESDWKMANTIMQKHREICDEQSMRIKAFTSP